MFIRIKNDNIQLHYFHPQFAGPKILLNLTPWGTSSLLSHSPFPIRCPPALNSSMIIASDLLNSLLQVFAHCYEHAFLHLVGSAVSKQQREAYRKYIIFIYKSMSRDDSSDPTDKGVDFYLLS